MLAKRIIAEGADELVFLDIVRLTEAEDGE